LISLGLRMPRGCGTAVALMIGTTLEETERSP
jgi:hypothetical protein